MIAVASIYCDRKAERIYNLPRLLELDSPVPLHVYANYQRTQEDPTGYHELAKRLDPWLHGEYGDLQVSLDVWRWTTVAGTSWRKLPQFDQDQSRLIPIVVARNMCIEFALATGASHLLFIDADVVPPVDIIPKLLALQHPLVGGLVPGRGVHSHVYYVFGESRRFLHESGAPVIACRHATCGALLIERRVFTQLRFGWGERKNDKGESILLSEDPAYGYDTERLGFGEWWVRPDVICQHLGELKGDEVSQY